jgi:hypothetical protein
MAAFFVIIILNLMEFINKVKVLAIYLSQFLIIGTGISCVNNPESERETYITTEKLYDDCSVYQMIYKEGDYAFRFALAGKCSQLTKEMYKADFDSFLKKYKNRIDLKNKRFIRIEYYDTLGIGKEDIEELIKITAGNLEMDFKLQKYWDEGFVLETAKAQIRGR